MSTSSAAAELPSSSSSPAAPAAAHANGSFMWLAAGQAASLAPLLHPLPLLAPRPPLPALPSLPAARPDFMSAVRALFSDEDVKPYKSFDEGDEAMGTTMERSFADLGTRATQIGGPLGTMAGTFVPMFSGGGTPGGSDIRIGEMLAAAPDKPGPPGSQYLPYARIGLPYLMGGGAGNGALGLGFAEAMKSGAGQTLAKMVGGA